jgi:hypothetical protein
VRRIALTLVTGAVLLGLAPSARAQVTYLETNDPYKQSPRWFAVELKFGPYTPDVDQEIGSSRPYREIFGKTLGLMSQLTLDVEFLKKHGVLAVGGTIGFFTRSGKSLLESGGRSDDSTSLYLLPLVLQLVYRWDYTVERWRVPLVPYVRAGIAYAFWWITRGDGKIARFGTGGKRAYGGNFGYQINVGLSLLLNQFDPNAAKQLDISSGINGISIFCEFVHSRLDNFGSSKSMHLGMNVGMLAGLTAEF